VTAASKLATKDDIMALYGPSNNSTFCGMPGDVLFGLYCHDYSPENEFIFCRIL